MTLNLRSSFHSVSIEIPFLPSFVASTCVPLTNNDEIAHTVVNWTGVSKRKVRAGDFEDGGLIELSIIL